MGEEVKEMTANHALAVISALVVIAALVYAHFDPGGKDLVYSALLIFAATLGIRLPGRKG